jgi:membrane associated rhomboid family serine protease
MGRLAGSPTVQTLAIMAVVFVVQALLRPFRILHTTVFVLGPTFPVRPWSLVTSVYAHANLTHLVSNAVMLALVGLIVERSTTWFRYHVFFITTGVLAGLAQVIVLPGSRVLGASGAIFALLGYVAAGNRVSGSVLDVLRLGRRAQITLFAALAVVVTVVTGSPGVALLAHFTGFLLGLLAGRMGLLAAGEPRDRTQVTSEPPG